MTKVKNMKLAEALIVRADLQKKMEQLQMQKLQME